MTLKRFIYIVFSKYLLVLYFKKSNGARRESVVVKIPALKTLGTRIDASSDPIQLPACGLGMQSRTAQSFGTLHPHGRPGGNS